VIILEGRVRATQRHCRRSGPESFIRYREERRAQIMTKQTPTDRQHNKKDGKKGHREKAINIKTKESVRKK
jgi:hypothetical protein